MQEGVGLGPAAVARGDFLGGQEPSHFKLKHPGPTPLRVSPLMAASRSSRGSRPRGHRCGVEARGYTAWGRGSGQPTCWGINPRRGPLPQPPVHGSKMAVTGGISPAESAHHTPHVFDIAEARYTFCLRWPPCRRSFLRPPPQTRAAFFVIISAKVRARAVALIRPKLSAAKLLDAVQPGPGSMCFDIPSANPQTAAVGARHPSISLN
jgi:hypothetical protein